MTSSAVLILAAGGLSMAAQVSRTGRPPSFRTAIATGLLGLVVVATEPANPAAVAGLARVIFLTSLLTNGYTVAATVNRIID